MSKKPGVVYDQTEASLVRESPSTWGKTTYLRGPSRKSRNKIAVAGRGDGRQRTPANAF
jgi:hypothetical protein